LKKRATPEGETSEEKNIFAKKPAVRKRRFVAPRDHLPAMGQSNERPVESNEIIEGGWQCRQRRGRERQEGGAGRKKTLDGLAVGQASIHLVK